MYTCTYIYMYIHGIRYSCTRISPRCVRSRRKYIYLCNLYTRCIRVYVYMYKNIFVFTRRYVNSFMHIYIYVYTWYQLQSHKDLATLRKKSEEIHIYV